MDGNTESKQSMEKVNAGVDCKLCIICQKSTSETATKAKEESLVKGLNCMKQYSDLSHPNITWVFMQFGNLTAQNLHSKDAIYHSNWYRNVVNERNLARAIERQSGQIKIATQNLFRQREGDQHHFHHVQLY